MAELKLHNQTTYNSVSVPGSFIDTVMLKANGEYVKVYLYLLRMLQHNSESFSVALMADRFETTETDIMRALVYWERANLLHLVFNSTHTLTDITILPLPEKTNEPPAAVSREPKGKKNTAPAKVVSAPAEHTHVDLSALSDDVDFAGLLKVAQRYFKRTLRQNDCEILGYWYQMFDRSYDIIEYLVEYCAEQGHTGIKYLEAVAVNWHEQGFTDTKQIRAYASARNQNTFSIMKAFGLTDRMPVKAELTYIKKWTADFSLELILKACEKTVMNTHKPSFEYANSILETWKKGNISTLPQVEALDLEHQQKAADKKAAATRSQKKPNQFHNFEQRTTDYDEMVANYYGYHQ